MSYLYEVFGKEVKIKSDAVQVLRAVGCNITQGNDEVFVDMSARTELNQIALAPYVDGLRQAGLSVSQEGRTLVVNGKESDYRAVAKMVAGTAQKNGGDLGKDFSKQVLAFQEQEFAPVPGAPPPVYTQYKR